MRGDESVSGKVDFIEFDTPTELAVTLLRGLGGTASISKLCKVSEAAEIIFFAF